MWVVVRWPAVHDDADDVRREGVLDVIVNAAVLWWPREVRHRVFRRIHLVDDHRQLGAAHVARHLPVRIGGTDVRTGHTCLDFGVRVSSSAAPLHIVVLLVGFLGEYVVQPLCLGNAQCTAVVPFQGILRSADSGHGSGERGSGERGFG